MVFIALLGNNNFLNDKMYKMKTIFKCIRYEIDKLHFSQSLEKIENCFN